MVGLSKDSAVNWIKSYDLPGSLIQYCTSSTIDQQDNVWVGGHVFTGDTAYGSPFLVKLDRTGDILWSRKLFDPQHTSRCLAIKALRNGDIAFLTFDSYNFELFRVSTDGNVIWSKIVSGSDSLAFDPSTSLFQSTYYNSHMIVEASDGSIFFSCNSNLPVAGKDCLFKFSANGDFVFANTYSWPVAGNSFPPEIQITENDAIIYAGQKTTGYGSSGYPYLFIVSKDGAVMASKAYALNQQVSWSRLNELNYFNHNIYLSTAGDYQFNTYIFDQTLTLISSTTTLGTNSVATDYGGMTVFDSSDNALLHVLNIVGPNGGNGFQFMRTKLSGLSCNQDNNPPVALSMATVSGTVVPVTPQITTGTTVFSQTVSWTPETVSIASSLGACGQ
jgi:hypothetical protein